MPEIQVGDAVITTKTKRVGLVVRLIAPSPTGKRPARATLIFVNNGSKYHYNLTHLRHATTEEVKGAGMYGVGMRILEEEEQD
jgi:hypothetical protein